MASSEKVYGQAEITSHLPGISVSQTQCSCHMYMQSNGGPAGGQLSEGESRVAPRRMCDLTSEQPGCLIVSRQSGGSSSPQGAAGGSREISYNILRKRIFSDSHRRRSEFYLCGLTSLGFQRLVSFSAVIEV